MNNDSPARDISGRALSWTPSQRELERQASRKAIGRKKAGLLGGSRIWDLEAS